MPSQTAAKTALSTGSAIPERILFGHTDAMHDVRARVEKVSQTRVPVLIIGESGVGKEVIARFIHSRSLLRGPFIRINCPGIPPAQLENELFGQIQAASPPAPCEPGLEEPAGEATVFLDGIGELDIALQSKLLQLLQDGQYPRIGGPDSHHDNARLICASSRPLEPEIREGRFRHDLFYRINVVTVLLPPLRDRRADIPDLIDYFLGKFSRDFNRVPHLIHPATRDLLIGNEWPGNIRQLESLIKRYVILDMEDVLVADMRPHSPLHSSSHFQHDVSLKQVTRSAKQDLERKVILDALSANCWNRKKAAEALHISYRALLYKIKQAGLPAKRSVAVAPRDIDD